MINERNDSYLLMFVSNGYNDISVIFFVLLYIWFAYIPMHCLQKKWDILSYPVYHSAYETVYLYENFIDPGYSYTATMAKLWGVLAWYAIIFLQNLNDWNFILLFVLWHFHFAYQSLIVLCIYFYFRRIDRWYTSGN